MGDKNFEDGCYSCSPGIELIAKVLAGECKMQYVKAMVGKGNLGPEEDPKEQEEVKEPVMEAQIAAVTNPVGGECQVTIQINSEKVDQGFYATGILLYASGADGGEVPYTYLVMENEPEWIRPKTSGVGKLATFDLIVAVGEVDQVTAVIDTDSIMTRQAAEKLLEDRVGAQSAYSAENTYAIGDTCIHDGLAWRCKNAIQEGKPWEEADWERVDLYDEVKTLQKGLAVDITLNNTQEYPFNNSEQTVTLSAPRYTSDYFVIPETIETDGEVGEYEVSEKLLNGFKLAFTGSAKTVKARCHVIGGM